MEWQAVGVKQLIPNVYYMVLSPFITFYRYDVSYVEVESGDQLQSQRNGTVIQNPKIWQSPSVLISGKVRYRQKRWNLYDERTIGTRMCQRAPYCIGYLLRELEPVLENLSAGSAPAGSVLVGLYMFITAQL
jgi:hypothetical protein